MGHYSGTEAVRAGRSQRIIPHQAMQHIQTVCKRTDSKTARVIAMSKWCIISTCPSGKLLLYASGNQANISARHCMVLFKYICLSSPGVEMSTQHCINCTGILVYRIYGSFLGHLRKIWVLLFRRWEAKDRPPLVLEWMVWKNVLH